MLSILRYIAGGYRYSLWDSVVEYQLKAQVQLEVQPIYYQFLARNFMSVQHLSLYVLLKLPEI